eukprot:SAG22_NODE_703_length_7779_cov_3.032161_2_plen_101_part_00
MREVREKKSVIACTQLPPAELWPSSDKVTAPWHAQIDKDGSGAPRTSTISGAITANRTGCPVASTEAVRHRERRGGVRRLGGATSTSGGGAIIKHLLGNP